MLLPNEWIENSIETYIYQHTTKSQIIYWIVLAAVTAVMIALPFIYVDISVQGSGVVRPVTEKTEIKSSITELIDSVYVREGDQVNKGDVLLRFRTNNSDYKINYQTNRLNDYEHICQIWLIWQKANVLPGFILRYVNRNIPILSKSKKNWKPLWHRQKKSISAIKTCLIRK